MSETRTTMAVLTLELAATIGSVGHDGHCTDFGLPRVHWRRVCGFAVPGDGEATRTGVSWICVDRTAQGADGQRGAQRAVMPPGWPRP